MAVIITEDDLAAAGTTGPLTSLWVEFVNQGDACLDAHGVPEATQKILKIALLKHLWATNEGGQLTSEHAPSGASRSFASPSKNGSTASLDLLRSLDKYGCLTGLIDADDDAEDKPRVFVGSFGAGGTSCR
ncbi:DUF7370 family protein [Carnimonas bestiolae]|uniref:DUF7370 family protein n=1 Tax=Carnimonas bestiolae TaxID=3402172 RepID=UPI003EDBD874